MKEIGYFEGVMSFTGVPSKGGTSSWVNDAEFHGGRIGR